VHLISDRLRTLIHEHTGLRERSGGVDRIADIVQSRVHALSLAGAEEYARFLNCGGSEANSEIRTLTVCLTTGETHFFRDRGQFDLIEKTILPALIVERNASKNLRIWSAGCSTGDEPYSIAMAVDSLLANRRDWNVEIFGTDINLQALDKARTGAYTDWSFRVIDDDRKHAYFDGSSGQWVLKRRIRNAVRFGALNLIHDKFQLAGIRDMDLILCRNVFIYFKHYSIQSVLDKMVAVLRPGGYLLTAHGELHGQEPAQLEALCYPESSVYRKRAHAKPKPALAEVGCLAQKALPAPKPAAVAPVSELEQMARDFANKGDHETAEALCKRVLEGDPFAIRTYYLLAKIAEERKQTDGAKEMLKKALYLAPDYVAAYIDLADVYEREKNAERAQKLRLSALECLRHPRGNSEELCEGATPADLIVVLESMVNEAVNVR
jgi:chemotaxis protein methyltransferase CheR